MNNELKPLIRKFYYYILKEHQKKLSGNILKFANHHLRVEFKSHYNSTDAKFLNKFVEEWGDYYVKLLNSKNIKDMTQDLDTAYLNEEQNKTLEEIKNIIRNDN